MLIGYLCLTPESLAGGLSAPHNALIAYGVGRLYIDAKTSVEGRPQLGAAFADIAAGDVMVSPTVNTLTDSIAGLLAIHARLDAKGASLRLLELAGGLPLDTATVEGRSILSALAVMNMLPPIAGAARATTPPVSAASSSPFAALMPHPYEQRPRGRPATAGNQAHEVNRLRAEGLRAVEIAAHLGIGRASVYRILSQGQPGEVAAPRPERVAEPAGMMSARIVGRFTGTPRG
jgi:DNA invertase Pin-like site-specific DNA recombinase